MTITAQSTNSAPSMAARIGAAAVPGRLAVVDMRADVAPTQAQQLCRALSSRCRAKNASAASKFVAGAACATKRDRFTTYSTASVSEAIVEARCASWRLPVQPAVLVSTPQTRAESRALALRLSIDAKTASVPSLRLCSGQFQLSVSGVKYPYDCARHP